MIRVILEVKGGIVNNVISDGPIEYILVDWDNLEAGDEFPDEADFRSADTIVEDIWKPLTSLRIDNILKNGEDDTGKVDI